MKSWYWASVLFLAGYVVGTVVGFATYYIDPVVMWVSIFVAMPLLFAYLCREYLARVRCPLAGARADMLRLILYWMALSFTLDALTYIVFVPALFHANQNWTFFIDQSPWIWISYGVLFASGYAGEYWHRRHSSRPDFT